MGGRNSDKDPKPEPNLELPSFRLRSKKKPAEASLPAPETSVSAPETSVPAPETSVAARIPPPPPAPPRRRPPAPPTTAVVHSEPPKVHVEEGAAEATNVRKPPKTARPPKPPRQPKAAKPPKVARERSTTPLRWLPGYVAATFTGALCGGLTVVLAWATARGCAEVRGVGTCGGYGVFALVIILGIDVVIASGLLRLFRVLDPATTALLGVGLVAVLAMLFFLGQTQSFAMVYVIPILMATTFAFAWWITQAIAQRVED